MKIAVNTRLLLPGKLDGMGWFAWHTLSRMTVNHPETEFIFFFDRPWSDEFVFGKNVTPVALFPQARHPFLYYWWFEHSIPAALKKYKADVFYSPDGYLSLSTKVPQVGVIHDLNFEHYPDDLPFLTRLYYRYFFPRFAKKAARIITVSEYSKSDLVKCYDITPDKIDVAFNGVNDLYKPVSIETQQLIRNKYTGGAPYFIFVGMLHQRKNIANLLRAFENYRHRPGANAKLLIVGHRKWWTNEMETVYTGMKYRDEVVFTGRQPIEELVLLVGSALAMTYVSYFEGFGVPIVEAMRCGVPVITSDVTSMPEVSGDAAILTDPFNPESIADAMNTIATNETLRKTLAEKGIERAKLFDWDKTSAIVWDKIIQASGK
ncbi:MAG: D-inositol 3-phosphate glycosyltransferase [Bacteroidetes bacterium ADurb.Bin397]|nr:MAG: D-inositol 3-phosphate glycosyltransferase [Bacteroidetes bacterium ADurb.Bin397]